MKIKAMSKLPTFNQVMPKRNVLIYALKCVGVPPTVSHPNFYWKRDGKKFTKLAEKAIKNNSDLVLVNYSDTSDKIKLIDVQELDATIGITSDNQRIITKTGYNRWFANTEKAYNII